jgi:hypothetical protein
MDGGTLTLMPKVILQLHLNSSHPTVAEVRKLLGLRRGQIDAKFGVRPVPPRENTFAVRVDADVAGRFRQEGRERRGTGTADARVALIH